MSCWLVPAVTVGLAGESEMELTTLERTTKLVVDAVWLRKVAEIWAEPGLTPPTWPLRTILAMPEAEVWNSVLSAMSMANPSEKVPVTVKGWMAPLRMEAEVGVSASAVSVALAT